MDFTTPIPYRVFRALITFGLTTKIPSILAGEAGIGKSSIIREIANKLGAHFEFVQVPGKNVLSDIIGAPRAVKRGQYEVIEYVVYDYVINLLESENSILLFEDLQTANPEMQSVIMGLMYDKQFGKHKLKSTAMCATINPEGGRLGLIPTLCNRLFAIPASFSMDEFADLKSEGFYLDGVPKIEIPKIGDWESFYKMRTQETARFLRNTPSFDLPDPDAGKIEREEQFPSARTWDYVDKLLGALDASTFEGEPLSTWGSDYLKIQKLILQGCVGTTAACAYFTYLREDELPAAEEILLSPDKTFRKLKAYDERQDRLYFMVRVMTRHVINNLNPTTWAQAWNVLRVLSDRERKSFAIVAAQTLLKAKTKDLSENPTLLAFRNLLNENSMKKGV